MRTKFVVWRLPYYKIFNTKTIGEVDPEFKTRSPAFAYHPTKAVSERLDAFIRIVIKFFL